MRRLVALGALALAACGELKGLEGPTPPLVSFRVGFYGDVAPLRPPGVTEEKALRLALVWGALWRPDPLCLLPPESEQAAAVIAAGCRDPFGFAPAAVTASVPIKPYGDTSLGLDALPSADVMVGDINGRVAYGSLVVFDDRDGSGALELATAHGTAGGSEPLQEIDLSDSGDIVYGASFVTMTEPDLRVAYLEGTSFTMGGTLFSPDAFYPRRGCLGGPGLGFSFLGASGFSREAGLEAIRTGTLPFEEPASCFGAPPNAFTVGIAPRPPAEVEEVACFEPRGLGAPRYNEPPMDAPDLAGRVMACAHLPALETGGNPAGLVQMLVSGRSTDRCKGLTHYVLRGCHDDATCALPEWDRTASPPSWWPCPE